MYRLMIVAALVVPAMASPAAAIEMFTDFDNGQNVGFPRMEVPTAVYGRGGWNGRAIERVPVPSGLPAMMPTGRGMRSRRGARWQIAPKSDSGESGSMQGGSRKTTRLQTQSGQAPVPAATEMQDDAQNPSRRDVPIVWPRADALFPADAERK